MTPYCGGAWDENAGLKAAQVIGRSSGAGDVAKSATIGATGGAAGETAAEFSPPQYAPTARLAGTLIGGGVGALATEAPRAAGQVAKGAQDFAAPLTKGGRDRLAADRLADHTEDLPAAREAELNARIKAS
jgi:hypothetical protein